MLVKTDKIIDFLIRPIGSIILGIVLTAFSFLVKKQGVMIMPCVVGLFVLVAGVMRLFSDKISPDSFFSNRKEGLGVLLFSLSLLIINVFYLLYKFEYISLLLFFGIVSFFFSLALILFPSAIDTDVPKVKQGENILDSPFEVVKQAYMFQEEHFYSNLSLYWDNASKLAKTAWLLALLVGGGAYLGLLAYLK